MNNKTEPELIKIGEANGYTGTQLSTFKAGFRACENEQQQTPLQKLFFTGEGCYQIGDMIIAFKPSSNEYILCRLKRGRKTETNRSTSEGMIVDLMLKEIKKG